MNHPLQGRGLVKTDSVLTRETESGLRLSFVYLFIYLFLKAAHLWHMEVPRLGVKSELWLPAYPTATAMPDP